MRITLLATVVSTGLLALVAPVHAAPAVTVAEAGFSAGPGTDYDVGKKLAIGSHVDVVWCGTHENWCLVDFHNKRGWVPLASLTFKVPHAVSVDDNGTSSGGATYVAAAPVGKPVGSQPEAMAGSGSNHFTRKHP